MYTWSQGRFVWLFARLASTRADLFSRSQRQEFLRLAKGGRDFLMAHCLMGPEEMRCVYVTKRDGRPKYADGHEGEEPAKAQVRSGWGDKLWWRCR